MNHHMDRFGHVRQVNNTSRIEGALDPSLDSLDCVQARIWYTGRQGSADLPDVSLVMVTVHQSQAKADVRYVQWGYSRYSDFPSCV